MSDSTPLPGPELTAGEPATGGRNAPVVLPDSEGVTPARRRGWRRALIALGVVLALVLVGGMGATYYYDSVKAPDELRFPASTTLYYSDGKTVLAQLGEVKRVEVRYPDLRPEVMQAAVAAADPDFWTDSGGALTRSMVRTVYDLSGDTWSARARVAILARKLEDAQSKQQVLQTYLNDMSFGRSTFGIEAAAQAYFGKSADKTSQGAPLTMAEAMVLMTLVDQPNPDPADPKGKPGFDPTYSATAEQNSRSRWLEIRDAMVDCKYLTSEQAARLAYPTTVKPYDPAPTNLLAKPVGLVANQVLSELTHGPSAPLAGRSWQSVRNGGYQIVTSIDSRAQAALEKSLNPADAASPMAGQPENLVAAAVMVEPGTGRVVGYYGGPNGEGGDYAGFYWDDQGQATGFGAHPGSSFLVHTLAAALQSGMSLNSRWTWTPHDMPGRSGPNQIRNNSTCPGAPQAASCSLLDSTVAGLYVPYYAITASLGAAKVLAMARDAGITSMWTNDNERIDLAQLKDMTTVVPSRFDTILGVGQYRTTVMDEASAMATYAAGGRRATAHFVVSVKGTDIPTYTEAKTSGQPILTPAVSADLDYALSQTKTGQLPGRDVASKTGAWAYGSSASQNSDAWMMGYTSSLATAVWIGNGKESRAIVDKGGQQIWGSGLPATIYRDVMSAAHDAMALSPAKFPAPAFGGTLNPPGSAAS